MNAKKTFIKPSIRVIEIGSQDLIATSGNGGFGQSPRVSLGFSGDTEDDGYAD